MRQDDLDKAIVFCCRSSCLVTRYLRKAMHQWLCQSETVPSVYEACRDVSLRKDGRLDFMHILGNRVANMHCARWQDTYRAISYHPVALFEYLAHVVRARIIVVACACCSGESRACFRKRSIIRLTAGYQFRRRLVIL
jgi:hypothetical protein